MKKLLLLLAGCFVCCSVFADDAAAVTLQLLETTMDRGIEILKDDSMCMEGKINAFEELLNKKCHTELMAKLVLGRSGWMKLSPEQRPEFIHAFIQMVTRSYYTKMDMADVTNVEIIYGENQEISANKRTLQAVIKDEAAQYEVEYKVALIDGRWGIYDLVVEGISLLASYRSEYADYLAQHSGAELVEMLQQKAAAVTEE